MPILSIPGRDSIIAEEPATIAGLTILVSVQCQCGAPEFLGLLNAQKAVCESCGAGFSLDAVSWERGSSTPSIAISSSPSRAKALIS